MNYTYVGGEIISLSGSAFDAQDGELNPTTFEWYVTFHHNEHAHVGPAFRKGVKSTIYEISRTNEVDASIYYEFILIAKNSLAQADTDRVFIYPNKSVLTITSNLGSLKFNQVTSEYSTPFTKQGAEGMDYIFFAPQQQVIDEDTLYFTSWGNHPCTSTGLLFRIPKNDTLITLNYVKKNDAFYTSTYNKNIDGKICVYTIVSTFSKNTCKIEKDTISPLCSITGNLSLNKDNTLVIYPNPTEDKVYIQDVKNIQNIRLTHLSTSQSLSISWKTFNEDLTIETKSLTKGVYVLAVSTLTHIYYSKLIVN